MTKNENKAPGPQKYSWKSVGSFDSFAEADARRQKLLSQEDCPPVKVRRCGPEGRVFKVKIGKALGTETAAKKTKKTKSKSSRGSTSPS